MKDMLTEKTIATIAMTVICIAAIVVMGPSAENVLLTALGAIGGYTVGVHKDG